jgi:hypothetical protein
MEAKDKIIEIINNNEINLAADKIMQLFNADVSLAEEQPILIGYLNRKFGYNGFKKNEIGTPVYSFKDVYYFEIIPLNGNKNINQKFYKESLSPAINFINK